MFGQSENEDSLEPVSYTHLDVYKRQKINKKNILEEINDGYIFFSKKDCPMCNEIYPIVEKELRNQNYKLYYFDFAYMRENNIYTDLELQKICDKYEINLVPLIIEIDGNKEVMRFPTSYEKKQISYMMN